MTTRIFAQLMLLAVFSNVGIAQVTRASLDAGANPTLISNVSEPPEMTGPLKEVPTPSAADKAFFDVLKQMGSKGFTEANLPILDTFIHNYPNYADAYYWRANAEACNISPRQLAKAKADLEAALSRKSDDSSSFSKPQALSLLAKTEFANGDHAAALNTLEKAMRLDLRSADQIFNIQGTSPETASDFCTWDLTDLRLLAGSAPGDWRPFALEGLYYQFFTTFNESYYPKAAAEFQKAAFVNPKTPIVPYLHGELYTKAAFWTKKAWTSDAAKYGIWRSSLPFFTQTARLAPNFEPAYAARAEAYLEIKQDALAIKDFDKVLSFEPANTTARSDQGLAYSSLGQYYAAISDFDVAIHAMKEGDDYLPDDYENRADAYVKARDYRSAIDDYTAALRLRLDNQIQLLSLKQFRDLYPEFGTVSDDVLLRMLNRRFAPQYEPEAFTKLMTHDNGSWGVGTLLPGLYEKRGDAYLSIGDYKRGILDYHRIFAGAPDYEKFTERWRSLGNFGNRSKFYLDVKASQPMAKPFPRIWVKKVGAKKSEVMAFEFDCSSRKLAVTSSVTYDMNDNVIENSSIGEGWSDVTPDTLGEQLWNGVCKSGSMN
jgi:tetratricopeptide (TPR) repeat protein